MSNKTKSKIDVEKYIIACLQDKESYKIIDEKNLDYSFFSPGALQTVFRLCVEYYENNKTCLTPEVLREEVSYKVITKEQASRLSSTFKHILMIKVNVNELPYYCDRLKDHYAHSGLKQVLQDAVEMAKSPGSDSNIKAVEDAYSKLNKLKGTLLDKDIMIEIIGMDMMEGILKDELTSRKNDPEDHQGILSGVKQIDDAFGAGLRPGELTVFMAPPAGGKTTMMISLADAMFRNSERNVAYLSLEMQNMRIALKHLSNNALVNSKRLELGDIESTHFRKMEEQFQIRNALYEKGARFDYGYVAGKGRAPMSYIEDAVKQILMDHPIDVLFVDYLECLTAGTGEDHWLEMGSICKFLRGLGSRYGFTTISAVQLKREAISRARKTKDNRMDFGADDAQGSNQISADCDRMYVLMKDKKDPTKIRWYTAKDRYGDADYEAVLSFQGEYSRIYGDATNYNHRQMFDGKDPYDVCKEADLVDEVDQIAPVKEIANDNFEWDDYVDNDLEDDDEIDEAITIDSL